MVDILIQIKGGIPEVIAHNGHDVHILYLDLDEAAEGRGDIVEVTAGKGEDAETIRGSIYCQQADELYYSTGDGAELLTRAMLIHELVGDYGEQWEEMLCRFCKSERNDGGDGYNGLCPTCADLMQAHEDGEHEDAGSDPLPDYVNRCPTCADGIKFED